MAKLLLVTPSSSPPRYFFFCSGVPNLAKTSDRHLISTDQSHFIALTHVAGIGSCAIRRLRSEVECVTHDLGHDRVLLAGQQTLN